MKYTINELANSKGITPLVREALLQMADYKQLYEQVCEQYDVLAKELEATNRQVEILSDALAESRREVAALAAPPVQEPSGIKGYAMALNEVALQLRDRYKTDLLSTPLWAEFEKARNKFASSVATPPAPAPVPLTDEQINNAWLLNGGGLAANRFHDFARAIEAAHGITAAPEKGQP